MPCLSGSLDVVGTINDAHCIQNYKPIDAYLKSLFERKSLRVEMMDFPMGQVTLFEDILELNIYT